MKVKFILPALTEAKSPFWRPIKYSLFPPLGLATLAGYLEGTVEAEIVDEHVQELNTDDAPDLVVIQVYITNAFRAYRLADHYRSKGCYVILGGLHVTSLPDEAALHADSIFLGPGEETFPEFLKDFRNRKTKKRYSSKNHTLHGLPAIRRDLIRRELYLVPNSLVVSRGCPHHCDFCYKDAFFKGGKSFYTHRVDAVLEEIESLPGRHLYFLDDHLLGNVHFASGLFEGMKGMNRVFQAASTVDAVLKGDLIKKAAAAGLRSLFVGFETLDEENLRLAHKRQSPGLNYEKAISRLHDLGIMINGSFVFGLDKDRNDVFERTVEWAVKMGITTATFHILTPYPGTKLFEEMQNQNRILSTNWDLYDTRHVVYKTRSMTAEELETGYKLAYKNFYSWTNILKSSLTHETVSARIKHFTYAGGWKKFEPLWNFMIKTKGLNQMLPLLEAVLSGKKHEQKTEKQISPSLELSPV